MLYIEILLFGYNRKLQHNNIVMDSGLVSLELSEAFIYLIMLGKPYAYVIMHALCVIRLGGLS